jgi:hypothetical protein
MPLVRSLFKLLGLKYRKENDPPERSGTPEEGETMTGRSKLKRKLSRRVKG